MPRTFPPQWRVSGSSPGTATSAFAQTPRTTGTRGRDARGDTSTATGAYQQLAEAIDVRFKRLSTRFIALYQQRAMVEARGDAERERSLTAALPHGLDAGEWQLTRDAATWYRDQLGLQRLPSTCALAEAVDRVWKTHGTPLSSRGQRLFNDARAASCSCGTGTDR